MAETFKFSVEADTNAAIKNIEKFTKSATSSVGLIENSFKLLGAAAVAAVGVISTQKLAGFLSDAAQAASEAETAFDQMVVALKLSGDFSESASKTFQDLASQMQEATGISDELVLSQIAYAKSLGISNKNTADLVKAANDLAAINPNIDFASAVRLLGQSLDGTAGRLNEVIPGIRNLSAEQLKAGAAIDLVRSSFDGAANALAGTFSGSIARARANFGELVETIGFFIIRNTVVLNAINLISNALVSVNKSIKGSNDAILEFIKSGIVGLINGFGIMIQAVSTLDTVVTKIYDAFRALFVFISSIPEIIKATADSIKSLDSGPLRSLNERLNKQSKDALKPLEERKKTYDELTQKVADFGFAIEKTEAKTIQSSKNASDSLKNAIKPAKELNLELDKLSKANKDKFSNIGDLFKNQKDLSKLTSEQQSVVISFAGLNSLKDGAQGAVKAFSSIAGTISNTILPGFGDIIGGLVELLAQSPEQLKAQINSFFEALPTILENIIANLDTILVRILEALAKALPRIIEVLATQAPFVAQRFSNALIANVPNIVRSFIVEFVRNIPAMALEMGRQAGQAIVDAVKGIVGFGTGSGLGIGTAVAGPAGGIFGAIGDIFGFAHGGLVPGGAPFSDRIPAMLTPGEVVIDRSLTSQLQEFLGGQNSQQTITLQVGEKELATVMYDIGRKGFRT